MKSKSCAGFLARTLDAAKFPFSDENRELKAILAKLSPPVAPRPVKPPLPAGGSSVLASRKRARRGG
jgi:hypothetical protein